MQLSKVTYALVAAGLIGGVATFYNQIDGSPVSPALAAPQPAATQAVIPTAAANLPDFTALVDRAGPAVVNISVASIARRARPASTPTTTTRTTRCASSSSASVAHPNGPA